MQTARDQNINSARLRLQQTTDIRRRVPEGFVGSDRELITAEGHVVCQSRGHSMKTPRSCMVSSVKPTRVVKKEVCDNEYRPEIHLRSLEFAWALIPVSTQPFGSTIKPHSKS